MASSSKKTYSKSLLLGMVLPMTQLCDCSTPVSSHAFTRLSQKLTGKSDSVSCAVTAPYSWVLFAQSCVYALQESLFPQPCGNSVIKSHWPSKSDSLVIPRPLAGSPSLGSLETSRQCENFFHVIVLQFVYHQPCCSVVGLWLPPPRGLMPHAVPPRTAPTSAPVPTTSHCWPMPP